MYRVNEIFYSLQGEGRFAGRPAVFIRFTGCNLQCAIAPGPKSPGGFDCDTEFESGASMPASAILDTVLQIGGECRFVILTGGEPLLQVDDALTDALHSAGFMIACETNGTRAIPNGIDWSVLSPKVAEHAIIPKRVNELRYVRSVGQAIPKPSASADCRYISPAFDGDRVLTDNIKHCMQLVKDNPEWNLSLQLHKLLRIR